MDEDTGLTALLVADCGVADTRDRLAAFFDILLGLFGELFALAFGLDLDLGLLFIGHFGFVGFALGFDRGAIAHCATGW